MSTIPAHDMPGYGLGRRVLVARWLTAWRDWAQACQRLTALHREAPELETLVDRALELGTHGLFEVRASQVRSEILALAQQVAELQPQVIVEIGVYKGGTGLIWSHLARDLVLLCDLRALPLESHLLRRFPPPGGPRLEVLCGDSHAPAFRALLQKQLRGRPIDFLFLDGDHSLDGIRQDFADYAPLVRPGGLIACHDIVPRQPFPTTQVHRFWEALKAEDKFELTEYVEDWQQVGYGIGVIHWPG